MVNTVENTLSICIKKQKEESKEILLLPSKKRKCDDNILNSSKSTKHSDTMKNKCSKCNRKLNGCYKCRWGNNYWNRHRFYDQHGCTFDFKSLAMEKLIINNPKLQNNRIGDQ